MYCLWCHNEILLDISWKNIFMLSKVKHLCNRCEEQLEHLHGKRCERCSRMSKELLCSDCEWWDRYFQQQGKKDPLTFNYSVYTYNNHISKMITKWKYRGDYVLVNAFKRGFMKNFQTIFPENSDMVSVPIPLSKDRLTERGFNQAMILAKFLPLQLENPLLRHHSEKQAKKTRYERVLARNPFFIKQPINKRVILVDDIYTTGATIRHAAALLLEQGCPEVFAYTLIRG